MFLKNLDDYTRKGILTERGAELTRGFYTSLRAALASCGKDVNDYEPLLDSFLEQIIKQIQNPYTFENYHEHITAPYNYYALGVDLFRPLVDFKKSKVVGLHNVDKMVRQLAAKENVVLLANHQSELDPQVISLLLEKTHVNFAKEIAFVAGDRVLTDPLAVPFSLGRNLFCIYSKRYINNPPERKEEKLRHNQRSMQAMEQKLAAGGIAIYVAPSGGRDRPNTDGVVEVAPFDPQSLEMLFLTAHKAKTPTHFYPLSLASFDLMPPPKSINIELGETRSAAYTPLHAHFGDELNIESYPGNDLKDKKERRQRRAEHIHDIVKRNYEDLLKT